MDNGINMVQFEALVRLARAEDLGEAGDVTTRLLPESMQGTSGRWQLRARQAGRFCGPTVLPKLVEWLAPAVGLKWHIAQREPVEVAAGDAIATLEGPSAQVLSAERTILNFLQRLSGVATLTAKYVAAVAGTHVRIYDTRKTTPGLRTLEKYAVRCGGGHNHRSGLHDAVLIKDNHLAGVPTGRLAHVVCEMLTRAASLPDRPDFIEVECDDLEQFAELLKVVGIDVILMDNFDVVQLRRAVAMRNDLGLRARVELEASGGVTLETVREIAETGVERIAVGAITHSAPVLDLALDAA